MINDQLPTCNKDFIITRKFIDLLTTTMNANFSYYNSLNESDIDFIDSLGILIGKSYNDVATNTRFYYNNLLFIVLFSNYQNFLMIDSIEFNDGQYKIRYGSSDRCMYTCYCDEDFNINVLHAICHGDSVNTVQVLCEMTYDENKNLIERHVYSIENGYKVSRSKATIEYDEITGDIDKVIKSNYVRDEHCITRYKNNKILSSIIYQKNEADKYLYVKSDIDEISFTHFEYYPSTVIKKEHFVLSESFEYRHTEYYKFSDADDQFVEFVNLFTKDNGTLSYITEKYKIDNIYAHIEYNLNDWEDVYFTFMDENNFVIGSGETIDITKDDAGRIVSYEDLTFSYDGDSTEIMQIRRGTKLLFERVNLL